VVFISQESSPDVIEAALSLPSRGFIHKLRTQTYLLPAIEEILEGKQFVSSPEPVDGPKGQAPHRHDVHFYPDDSTLLDSLDCFIATTLMARNAAIVLATKPHREALVERLRDSAVDIDSAIQKGTYIALDAAEILSTIMLNGGP
jgi:hypothetical protein